jgi:acetylornithine deacetylase/succinyl-diaminopimelate desuccinylase-like protein
MTYYQQHQSDFLEGLKAFLRIPSISALSEHKPDIRRAAEFARDELLKAGMTSAELIEGEGNPLVYAEWLGAPGKPTILFYGHYDVQPPDPLNEWKSKPFEPEIRGDDIFARGAADDKGQVYIQIKAVEGLMKTTGRLPVNVKFLRGRGRNRWGAHRSICQNKATAPESRRRCHLRYRDVRSWLADHLCRPARHRVRGTGSRGR